MKLNFIFCFFFFILTIHQQILFLFLSVIRWKQTRTQIKICIFDETMRFEFSSSNEICLCSSQSNPDRMWGKHPKTEQKLAEQMKSKWIDGFDWISELYIEILLFFYWTSIKHTFSTFRNSQWMGMNSISITIYHSNTIQHYRALTNAISYEMSLPMGNNENNNRIDDDDRWRLGRYNLAMANFLICIAAFFRWTGAGFVFGTVARCRCVFWIWMFQQWCMRSIYKI